MKRKVGILFIVAVWATNLVGQGTVLWDESVNGPLSNDGNHPTSLGTLLVGTNSLLGATESEPFGNNWLVNADFVTFTVPNGSLISRMPFSASKPVAVWIGTDNFSTQLGYVVNPANGDLLPQLGLGSVGAGLLDLYVMNNDFQPSTSVANYRIDFFVQTVPEPSAVSLLLLGAGVVGVLGWKKVSLN